MDTELTQTDLEALAARVADKLLARQQVLAIAESCTGGWVGQCLTAIAGSSLWFDRGFVTYSNAAKIELLDVPEFTIKRHGAVSEATARAMVQGALAKSRAHWALAITGVAGPTGGSAKNPVGTVCFAWAEKDGGCVAETCRFDGDRQAVRLQSVAHALNGLLQRI